MGKILIVLTLMVSAIINGCSSKPEQPPPKPEPQAKVAPKVEVVPKVEVAPKAEVVVPPKLSNRSDRPEWTRIVPDPANGYIFYTAKSGVWLEESDADDEAMRRLRPEASRVMGVTIAEKQELAKMRNGLSGSAKEFAELEKIFLKTFSINSVRLVKAKMFYHENVVDSAGTRGIRTHILAQANLKNLNEIAQQAASNNFKLANKKMKEERDEKMKKQWKDSTNMWKELGKEEFFK